MLIASRKQRERYSRLTRGRSTQGAELAERIAAQPHVDHCAAETTLAELAAVVSTVFCSRVIGRERGMEPDVVCQRWLWKGDFVIHGKASPVSSATLKRVSLPRQ